MKTKVRVIYHKVEGHPWHWCADVQVQVQPGAPWESARRYHNTAQAIAAVDRRIARGESIEWAEDIHNDACGTAAYVEPPQATYIPGRGIEFNASAQAAFDESRKARRGPTCPKVESGEWTSCQHDIACNH